SNHIGHKSCQEKPKWHDNNQLVKISDLVNRNNIQFVASILKDKLPDELNDENYFILKLSEDDKLFRIEERMST
ncbi:ATPase, partial [Candidatus Magnetomorum sp. HK-1]